MAFNEKYHSKKDESKGNDIRGERDANLKAIEEIASQSPTAASRWGGISLTIISLICNLFAVARTGEDSYINVIDLTFREHLITALVLFASHICLLGILISNISKDRFRFATLFSALNVFLFFLLWMWEIPARYLYVGANEEGQGWLGGFGALASLINLLLLGLEAGKTKPIYRFFKYYYNKTKNFSKIIDLELDEWGKKRRNNLKGSKVDSFVVGLISTIFYLAIIFIMISARGTNVEKYVQVALTTLITMGLYFLYWKIRYK